MRPSLKNEAAAALPYSEPFTSRHDYIAADCRAGTKHDSRPSASSILPAVFGGAVLLGAFGFIGWGIWQAMHPAPVPLQGLMDATTVSVAAKVPGRLAAVTVRKATRLRPATR